MHYIKKRKTFLLLLLLLLLHRCVEMQLNCIFFLSLAVNLQQLTNWNYNSYLEVDATVGLKKKSLYRNALLFI